MFTDMMLWTPSLYTHIIKVLMNGFIVPVQVFRVGPLTVGWVLFRIVFPFILSHGMYMIVMDDTIIRLARRIRRQFHLDVLFYPTTPPVQEFILSVIISFFHDMD